MASKILIFGSLNADLVSVTPRMPVAGETLQVPLTPPSFGSPPGGDSSTSFVTVPGGKGLNQCIAAQRTSRSDPDAASEHGIVVEMRGAVGTDEFGPLLKGTLLANGVDSNSVVAESGNSGVAVIIVEEDDGMNRILISPGANGKVAWEKGSLEGVGMLVCQLEVPTDEVLAAIHEASANGTRVLFNPAPAKVLPKDIYPKVNYLIVNETEAAILGGVDVSVLDTNEGIQQTGLKLQSFGSKNVVVTLGSRGCWWLSESGHSGLVPAMKVAKVVDTTGAGDTWVGAFAVAIMEGKSMEGAVDFATRAAAVAVTKPGAVGGIPWRGEIASN